MIAELQNVGARAATKNCDKAPERYQRLRPRFCIAIDIPGHGNGRLNAV